MSATADNNKKRNLPLIIGLTAIMGLFVQVAASWLVAMALSMFPGATESYDEMINSVLHHDARLLVYVAFFAPLIEELVFRIVLLGAGLKVMPFMAANIAQAVLFGIYHGNLVQGLYAFFLGLMLGCVRHNSGLIYLSFILHMCINIAGIYQEYIPFLQGDVFGVQIVTSGVVSIIAVTAIMVKLEKLWSN